jgi:biotin synthase-like enzyme
LSVPRIATLAAAAVTRVNHVLETASSPDFFSSLLGLRSTMVYKQQCCASAMLQGLMHC